MSIIERLFIVVSLTIIAVPPLMEKAWKTSNEDAEFVLWTGIGIEAFGLIACLLKIAFEG